MGLNVTVTANEAFADGATVDRAALRRAAKPTVSITGAVSAGCFAFSGQPHLIVLVALYVAFGLAATLVRAEAFLRYAIVRNAVTEKSETVSLLLREFEENEADWLWQIDKSRRVRAASPRFAFALGETAKSLEGRPFFDLISGEDWETGPSTRSLRELAEHIKTRQSFSNLLVQVIVAGEERWWELSGTPITGDKGEYLGYRGVGSDVTEQRNSSEKIAYLARYDTLTGLPNRLMLHEALGEAMEEARDMRRRCAFVMIDLDRFKAVNDSLGHQIGDRLLEQVSGRLAEIAGENELCGRLGGDEFGIVVRDACDFGAVDSLARKVIERLSQPYEVDAHTLFVGASAGSALAPRDGKTVEDLMRNADLALYRAKDGGRGVHFPYEPSLHADAEERRQLEFSLRKALEKDELLLNFQPVVDAKTEQVVSFEALIRWQSEEHGLVSPGKFIPLAEDTRLIVPIGTWVLKQACKEAMAWPGHVKVNVNVSPEQLVEPDFVSTVVDALTRSGLDPRRLEIEVTESIFLSDAEVARVALAQVMALGCQVALDDFGTGYSSLSYLRTAPFDKIKIDQSFVRGATEAENNNAAILSAIVGLADALDMETVAEGVEARDELALVTERGATLVQGYIFSRPMPNDEFIEDLQRSEPTYEPRGPAKYRADRKTVFRRIGLIHEDSRYKVVMRNLSKTGAMIEGLLEVPLGTEVVLDLGGGQLVVATVRRSKGSVQGVEFETSLISDGADGLCTRHRVSPYQIEAAGRPLAALPHDPYALIMSERLNSGARKKFVEVEVGNPKPGTGY